MPGALKGAELEEFIRDVAATYHHQTRPAKMGRDSMSVVDAKLQVYGIDNLRIADGSILPRVTTGNTMAPCVIIASAPQRRCGKTTDWTDIKDGRLFYGSGINEEPKCLY